MLGSANRERRVVLREAYTKRGLDYAFRARAFAYTTAVTLCNTTVAHVSHAALALALPVRSLTLLVFAQPQFQMRQQ
jgi:hypothetical protein